eukprot:TRINITY_DN15854_c0_g1_i2.p2 TRINITY_DN15854_c0_g1~~TRINITY_DN15854_c0_g1_i2.p2  ORF type:complete len:181 (-),score=11.73 TRINITY_DN15854_c0_g1_i2:96-638(-)
MGRTFQQVITDANSGVGQRGVSSMKSMQRVSLNAVVVAALLGLGACSGMSSQGQSTAIGAGAGAIGGAVLTGGSAAGTVGGAVVGGVIGHEVAKQGLVIKHDVPGRHGRAIRLFQAQGEANDQIRKNTQRRRHDGRPGSRTERLPNRAKMKQVIKQQKKTRRAYYQTCLLYTSPSPRDQA